MGGKELDYVRDAFDSNWLSTVGPSLAALEREFSKLTGHSCVALASGTAALHLGLKALGVQPGDEVVAPTLTFAATCNPILYENAIPVLMDSDRETWNLDPSLLAAFLTRRARANKLPKAVIVVHLFGQSADMDAIRDACGRFEVPILEDAAEALGASYKGRQPGVFGDVGVFSFNGNKIITCTGGGMLVSPHADWVEKARFWSTQARDPDPWLNNYLHSELGYNYRLSNVLAAIALGQLEVIEQRVAERRAVAFRYRDAFAELPGIDLMPQAAYGRHTNWLSCFLIDEERFGLSQPELVRFLHAANVDSRPVWKPMHTQRLYQNFECVGGSVAEDLNQRGICLPSSSNLAIEDQQFVIDRVREAHRLASSRPHIPAAALAAQG
jgi:pyridoxal phosphate-dependent aminotransferase EpsN